MKNTQNIVTVLGVLIVVLLLGFGQTSNQNQQASAQSAIVSGARQLHLFDGNNQDLGILVRGDSKEGKYSTYFKLDDDYTALLDFKVVGGGDWIAGIVLRELEGAEVFFSQADCVGDAFMRVDPDAQQIFYETTHPNSGPYFVQRLDTFISGATVDPRRALSKMGSNGCIGANDFVNKTVLIHYITLPFSGSPAWPLRVGYPTLSATSLPE